MKKRILSLILVFMLILSMVPAAFAADIASGTCGANMSWRVSDSGVLTISGTGKMDDYSTSSKAPWYSYRSQIFSVVIEEGVTGIGDYAFYMCARILTVSLPDSLTSLGDRCFNFCYDLTAVTIPPNVTAIADHAFFGCSDLASVTLPEGVTSIGTCSFSDCSSLTGIDLPDSLTSIGQSAFSSCLNLNAIELPAGVRTIGPTAFHTCRALENIAIPEGVTTIDHQVFYNCSALTSVMIPASVTSIDAEAFYGRSADLAIYGPHGAYAESYAAEQDITYNPMHSYDQVTVTAPTCTGEGYTTHTCSCGDDFTSDITAALGHDYAGGVCTRCGEKDMTIPELPGDVNRNGKVDVVDILKVKQLSLTGQWTAEELAYGDQNGNGILDTGDMLLIKDIILAQ